MDFLYKKEIIANLFNLKDLFSNFMNGPTRIINETQWDPYLENFWPAR